MSTAKRILIAAAVLVILVGLVVATSSQAAALTVTVTGVSDGNTEKWIGATEGDANFDIQDLVDIGLQNYRIWVSSAELEPVDDDGVYGSPSIAEIKANPDIIPWSVWETNFRSTAFRQHGVSLYDQLDALSVAGILPVTSLVNVNNSDLPVWMHELNPPDTTEDWNEWWEHVFAVVYYTNVVEGMEVHDWQVLNEPDNLGQGWDGSLADYIVLTQYTADAIHYVYDTFLPGKTARVYAPVSTHCNEWIEDTLIYNDAIVDVIDWHRYGPPYDEASQVNAWITQYDTDGQHEDPFISEWGSYRGGYESHGNAMNYSGYALDHSIDPIGYVGGSSIFPFYDWLDSSMTGLVLADGTRTASFYAFRLIIRAMGGGKTRYVITEEPPRVHNWAAAVDEGTNTMHVVLWSKGVKDDVVTVDVSAHVSSSTATIYRYAEGVLDEMIGTAPVTNGVVVVDLLASSVMEIAIPLGGGPGPTDTPEPGPTDTPEPGPTDTPEPGPTDTPPAGGAMHVGDITMSCGQQQVKYWAIATVTILDAGDQPVDTATVYGSFTGASSASVSDATNGDGQVSLIAPKVSGGGSWTFTVDDVVKSGWTYDEGANVETSDSITCP